MWNDLIERQMVYNCRRQQKYKSEMDKSRVKWTSQD